MKQKTKLVKSLPPSEPPEPSKIGARPKPPNPSKQGGIELPIPEKVEVH